MATTGQNGGVPDAATQPTPASSANNPTGTTPATTSATNDGESPATPAANKPIASLRLPPISTEETELWLSQVECAFGVAGVQDDSSRYQVLVVNLPTEVAIQVRDIINSPNPTYGHPHLCSQGATGSVTGITARSPPSAPAAGKSAAIRPSAAYTGGAVHGRCGTCR